MKKFCKVLLIIIVIIFSGLFIYYVSPDKKLPNDTKVDFIIVYKSKRQLDVYSKNEKVKTYKISLGGNPIGHKNFEGDNKTPEGIYFIDGKNNQSGYHKNLGISYPNQKDIENAKKTGKSAGGDIKIHGLRNGLGFIGKFQRWYDWTAGCIALTNDEIDELYIAVPIGTKIEIKP